MYKEDLALNDLQWLICKKKKTTKIPNPNYNQRIYLISFATDRNKLIYLNGISTVERYFMLRG